MHITFSLVLGILTCSKDINYYPHSWDQIWLTAFFFLNKVLL